MTADLLALLVEVTSVGVAGQQLKKPITLPRPNDRKRPVSPARDAQDAAFKKGVGVLAATTKTVSRK